MVQPATFTTLAAAMGFAPLWSKKYQDILANGFRGSTNSYSTGKLFTANIADAKFFNEAFGNHIIVKARIPAGISFEKIFGVAGLKYIYNVPSGALNSVKFLTLFRK